MAKQFDDGGPAFPLPVAEILGRATHSGEFAMGGMSLRDYFAAHAMQGFCACYGDDMPEPKNIAAKAYRFADLMLAERVKQPQAA
jgi:hypothetical protein